MPHVFLLSCICGFLAFLICLGNIVVLCRKSFAVNRLKPVNVIRQMIPALFFFLVLKMPH